MTIVFAIFLIFLCLFFCLFDQYLRLVEISLVSLEPIQDGRKFKDVFFHCTGNAMSIRVMTDDGGKSRGFGFVSFERHEDAQKVKKTHQLSHRMFGPGQPVISVVFSLSRACDTLAGSGRVEREGDERQAHLRRPCPEEGGAPDGAEAQI